MCTTPNSSFTQYKRIKNIEAIANVRKHFFVLREN